MAAYDDLTSSWMGSRPSSKLAREPQERFGATSGLTKEAGSSSRRAAATKRAMAIPLAAAT
jgi:hypothetical protein